ncbi:MAG: hypothetical protein O2931_03590 [Planctomycetota bacterium]|nr:hypothetical protein [Planctomycetota bacterium]MDA1177860.1 hypothetical protein [Planctomycetota bacterium]
MTCQRSVGVLSMCFLCVFSALATAQSTFRGIQLDQGNNLIYEPVLDRVHPWFVDVVENFTTYTNQTFEGQIFSRNLSDTLAGTYVDGLRIGFVPPTEGLPDGPLTGTAAESVGRWMSGGSPQYTMDSAHSGSTDRTSDGSVALACINWRVTPGLGNAYLLEMGVDLAEGESATVGYFGDIGVHGNSLSLLAGPLGQLAFGVERGTGGNSTRYDWTISWWEGTTQQTDTGSVFLTTSDPVTLQLGWEDGANHRYDAWIETTAASFRIWQDTMQDPIDVFGIGFELSGTQSKITEFVAAVPEPPMSLFATGAGLLLAIFRRRRNCYSGS